MRSHGDDANRPAPSIARADGAGRGRDRPAADGRLDEGSGPALAPGAARFWRESGLAPARGHPDTIGAAAPPLHDAYALLPIFGWMIPLFVLTAVVALLLPEVPLSRKTGMEQVAEAGGDQ